MPAPLTELRALQTVLERDIDLLVLEELRVAESFRHHLVETIFCQREKLDQFIGAWHSVTHPWLGESDLVFAFHTVKGDNVGVLIENKISANFMPHQAERYQARGTEGRGNGWWNRFFTCLLAPRKYIEGTGGRDMFDHVVAYEDLIRYFEGPGSGPREAYKVMLLSMACANAAAGGYVMTEDEAVTAFFRRYWELAVREFPELRMAQPRPKPRSGNWSMFTQLGLPKGVSLLHKGGQGSVDLSFARTNAEDLMALVHDHLEPGVLVVQTGHASVIRIETPKLDPTGDFSEQEQAARTGMAAASRLLQVFRANPRLHAWPLMTPAGANR